MPWRPCSRRDNRFSNDRLRWWNDECIWGRYVDHPAELLWMPIGYVKMQYQAAERALIATGNRRPYGAIRIRTVEDVGKGRVSSRQMCLVACRRRLLFL